MTVYFHPFGPFTFKISPDRAVSRPEIPCDASSAELYSDLIRARTDGKIFEFLKFSSIRTRLVILTVNDPLMTHNNDDVIWRHHFLGSQKCL